MASHIVYFKAWIDPNNPTSFHVPLAGQDLLAGAKDCRKCPEPHKMIPEMRPKVTDESLYEKVRGKELLIMIGPSSVFTD